MKRRHKAQIVVPYIPKDIWRILFLMSDYGAMVQLQRTNKLCSDVYTKLKGTDAFEKKKIEYIKKHFNIHSVIVPFEKGVMVRKKHANNVADYTFVSIDVFKAKFTCKISEHSVTLEAKKKDRVYVNNHRIRKLMMTNLWFADMVETANILKGTVCGYWTIFAKGSVYSAVFLCGEE